MHVLPPQVTSRSILQVLLGGFGLVILLLVVAAFVSVTNIRAIQRNAATLVGQQEQTGDLVDEIESEQEALSAVVYHLARDPQLIDREKILSELDAADDNVSDIADRLEGAANQALGHNLKRATEAFTAEARRLLAQEKPTTLLSGDLFQRHRQVTNAVAQLVAAGRKESQAAQRMITQQSSALFRQSFGLLAGCLLLALFSTGFTVYWATGLFRRMEWQSSELSRVSWHLLESQENVARRFSHELHDELGQSLTALKASLMTVEFPEGANGRRKDCLGLVDGAIRNVREMSQLLRPTILDDFGLDASLRWLAEKFTERTGINVDYVSDFSGRLADETETHLFRIAQEALTNVARHARAKRVSMELHAEAARLHLLIEDDGVGLTASPSIERGLGMIGMRARARSTGGELSVRSRPDEGVRIEVNAPMRAPSDGKDHTHLARG
jgi:signal transduction histidine kinase